MDNQTILNYESAAAAALNGKPKQRGPYKRGPKSTETGPVVGIHEEPEVPPMPKIEDYGWRPDTPGAKSGRGSFETKAQEQAYEAAFDAHVAAVNAHPGKPITINRPNIPNRYDREALRDFYDGLSLKRAQGNFDFMMDKAEAVTEKQAFATTIYMYPPTI